MSLTTAPASDPVLEILGDAASRYSAQDVALFEKAYAFGKKAHEPQRRQSGEPYFNHCIEVARLLAELRMDPATLAAGLLHDVIEDTEYTREDLDAMFPEPIGELVEGVTKLGTLQFNSDRERQAANLRKMILAMARDVRVIIIKLCDRLHNMSTLEHLSEFQQQKIARSTIDIYAPLANRLGMSKIRAELEDRSMYYLFPAAYAHMRNQVAKKRALRESIVNRSIDALREHLQKDGLTPEITGRPKHFYSIYQKMQRQSLSFDEIYDLIAIRIFAQSVEECYEILGRVHALWHPVPGRFKDYIGAPKDNGYQSIHTTVIGLGGEVTEIQIRTHKMHRSAEVGIAAHWRYKEGAEAPSGQEEKLNWLRSLVGWLQDVRDPTEFMDALKKDVFSDVVYVFTPQGDVVELPVGATALDFAYYIHTEVGHQCSGARINRRIARIGTELHMGDIVEIIRSRTAHPTSDWLDIATTTRARSKIKHTLKTANFEENRQLGLDLLTRALRAKGLEIPAGDMPERLERSLPSFRVSSFDDLLCEIGFGAISAPAVANRLASDSRPQSKKKKTAKSGLPQIVVDEVPNAMARVANCCSPMPGDPITGFITRGRGVSVHRSDCPNMRWIVRARDEVADRLVSVRWSDEDERPCRKVSFRIVGKDRQGLLRDIANVFTSQQTDIIEVQTKSIERNGRAHFKFLTLCRDAAQIATLMHELQRMDGVISVNRVISAPERGGWGS